jgi:hypothetical protein
MLIILDFKYLPGPSCKFAGSLGHKAASALSWVAKKTAKAQALVAVKLRKGLFEILFR